MNDPVKMSDQIRLLEACMSYTDTGKWNGTFSYPNAGWDLVRQGLVTEDQKVTIAGRSVLWFLGKGDDPTSDSKSFQSFSIPLPDKGPSDIAEPEEVAGEGSGI